MTADPQSLGMRIRRARERARLSQPELAQAVGASVRAVGDWENDRRKPRNRLGALEEVLGVSLGSYPADDVAYDRALKRIHDLLHEEFPADEAERMEAIIEAGLEGRIPPRRRAAARREKAG